MTKEAIAIRPAENFKEIKEQIDKPSQELLKRVFEAPIVPRLMEIDFIQNNNKETLVSGPSIKMKFYSNSQDGNFYLHKTDVDYGYAKDPNYLEIVHKTNERLITGAKPDQIKYQGNNLSYENLRDSMLDTLVKEGYQINYFSFLYSYRTRSGYAMGLNEDCSLEYVGGDSLILKVKEESGLPIEDRDNLISWFNTLQIDTQK